jgi:hypothetical protein
MPPTVQKLDPVTLSLLNAPVDDEPTTEADLKAIEESKEAMRRGDCVSLQELAKEPGIELPEAP